MKKDTDIQYKKITVIDRDFLVGSDGSFISLGYIDDSGHKRGPRTLALHRIKSVSNGDHWVVVLNTKTRVAARIIAREFNLVPKHLLEIGDEAWCAVPCKEPPCVDNIEIVPRAEATSKQKPRGSCLYKGVTRTYRSKSYTAALTIDNKSRYFGVYKTQEEAARAVNEAIIDLDLPTHMLNKIP